MPSKVFGFKTRVEVCHEKFPKNKLLSTIPLKGFQVYCFCS